MNRGDENRPVFPGFEFLLCLRPLAVVRNDDTMAHHPRVAILPGGEQIEADEDVSLEHVTFIDARTIVVRDDSL